MDVCQEMLLKLVEISHRCVHKCHQSYSELNNLIGTEEGIETSFCDVKIQEQDMLGNVWLACHRRD